MRFRGFQFETSIAILVLLVAGGCRETKKAESAKSEAVAVVPFAPVGEVFTTKAGALLLTSQPETMSRDTSVYHCGSDARNCRKIYEAKSLQVLRAGDDEFVMLDGSKIVPVNAKGELGEAITSPWERGSCQANARYLVCATDREDVTEQSPDYNALGYTAIGVVDLKLRVSWRFNAPRITSYFFFSPSEGVIYTSTSLNENSPDTMLSVFDMRGARLKVLVGRKASSLSPWEKYAVPQLHEGGLPWEVYETATGKELMQFGHGETNGDQWIYGEWNPVRENLLMVQHTRDGLAENGMAELEIYDVASAKRVSAEKLTGGIAYGWERDGRGYVMVGSAGVRRVSVP